MYLPQEILNARVLISVKTYPLPSTKYGELVCTAGFLPDGKWVRLYPIPFRDLPYDNRYSKYHWVSLDLIRNPKDFRPESYRPKFGVDRIKVGEHVGTGKNRDWAERKKYALREVFTSMNDILQIAKSDEKRSLATLKPRAIIDFVIEKDERDWKQKWQDQLLQYNLFDLDEKGEGKKRDVVAKVPYKYSYKFLSQRATRRDQEKFSAGAAMDILSKRKNLKWYSIWKPFFAKLVSDSSCMFDTKRPNMFWSLLLCSVTKLFLPMKFCYLFLAILR